MSIESDLRERLSAHLLSFVGHREFGMIERAQKSRQLLRAELMKELEEEMSYTGCLGNDGFMLRALARLAIFESMVK